MVFVRNTYFLCISAVCDRLILIVLKQDMLQGIVRYVFDDVPSYRKATSPFILAPEVHVLVKIDRTNHLSHATEVPTAIHLINRVPDLIIEL